jgi:hypothetical protein
MGDAGKVTETHLMLSDGLWKPAGELFSARVPFCGEVFNLTVATDEPLAEKLSPKTERSYVIAVNGLVAHNLKPII